ncbi:ribosome hibernation-promoting factor, HPF/YfiA family [Melioribacteraceae bacterium 4301-Me]|uniref:ribosome hibernation-promoting factor, HPF/YfiA family n=1 Tax=Pyranulibacter aquaticus TaxID=3163344 RepID=UPI003594A94E
MNIQITSRKFRAKDSLKSYITKSLKSLEKLNDQILDVDVILSFTHIKDSIKTVEINAQIPGKLLSVSSSTDDFKKSVIDARNKLERQLRKEKTKKLAKTR